MALYSYKLANALAEEEVCVTLFVDDKYELDNLPTRFHKMKTLSSRNVSTGSEQHRIVRIFNILAALFYNWYQFYRYVKKTKRHWAITWRLDEEAVAYDHRSDGMYPLLTNDKSLTALQVLEAHKRQPTVEKRFKLIKCKR